MGGLPFRQMTTETAGFYNSAGFNDDTRAFCTFPDGREVARRVDCAFFASLISQGRLDEDETPMTERQKSSDMQAHKTVPYFCSR